MQRTLSAAVLAVALAASGCRALNYEHGGLRYAFARVSLPARGDFSISAGTITSVRGPITRVVYRVGRDMNGDGKLDPEHDHLQIHIDNPNPTSSVSLAGVQGTIGKGEAWIAELHVWQGGDKPIISESWTNQP